MATTTPAAREAVREERFRDIWSNELNDAFADIARYYDRANEIAALGMWSDFLDRFMRSVDIAPTQKVLDVCAGTNVPCPDSTSSGAACFVDEDGDSVCGVALCTRVTTDEACESELGEGAFVLLCPICGIGVGGNTHMCVKPVKQ